MDKDEPFDPRASQSTYPAPKHALSPQKIIEHKLDMPPYTTHQTPLHHSSSTRSGAMFTRTNIISIIVTGAASLLYVFYHNPHTHTIVVCPFHVGTNLWCPLCGGLRWTYDIMHGNMHATIYDNAALPLLLFLAAGYGYCHHIRSAQQKLWLQGLIVALILWTIVRNLPWYPYPLQ